MVWARRFLLRLQTLFRRHRSTQRLNDEIQFHLEQQIAENIAAGMNPQEARYATLRAFGNSTLLKEETREAWGWIWAEQMAQDLRYAFPYASEKCRLHRNRNTYPCPGNRRKHGDLSVARCRAASELAGLGSSVPSFGGDQGRKSRVWDQQP
jgi:hypothetical protein